MKLNWLTSMTLEGLFAMLVSGVGLYFLGLPENIHGGYMQAVFVVTAGVFAAGLMIVVVAVWEYFFGSSGKPNYIYRPEIQQILVRYSSTPFLIERNGTRIWVGMVLDASLTDRQITLHEVDLRPSFTFKKDYFTGKEGDDLFITADEQRLHLAREIMGIKIWWEEENGPWKIVEKNK